MSTFEGIFVPEQSISHPSADMSRLKLGEIFNNCRNEYELVCVHCTKVFKDFNQFTLHAQEHLVCRFKTFIDVKEENPISRSHKEIQSVTNGEFFGQFSTINQDDASGCEWNL